MFWFLPCLPFWVRHPFPLYHTTDMPPPCHCPTFAAPIPLPRHVYPSPNTALVPTPFTCSYLVYALILPCICIGPCGGSFPAWAKQNRQALWFCGWFSVATYVYTTHSPCALPGVLPRPCLIYRYTAYLCTLCHSLCLRFISSRSCSTRDRGPSCSPLNAGSLVPLCRHLLPVRRVDISFLLIQNGAFGYLARACMADCDMSRTYRQPKRTPSRFGGSVRSRSGGIVVNNAFRSAPPTVCYCPDVYLRLVLLGTFMGLLHAATPRRRCCASPAAYAAAAAPAATPLPAHCAGTG